MSILSYESPFARFVNRLVDILLLGLIFVLCCIPIITIGASLSALYYVTLKMARGHEGGLVKQFFKGFKDNFWKGTALWLIVAVVGFLLYLDFYLLYTQELAYESIEWILFIIVGVVILMIANYIFPLQAQFENPVFRTIKNAFILSLMNLPRSILIILIELSPLLVFFFYPEVLYILIFFIVAGLPYLKSEIFVRIFEKYIDEQLEGDLYDTDVNDPDAYDSVPSSVTPVEIINNSLEDEETEE